MEVFVLHILKLNIIAAVVILLVKVLAALLKGKVSARWKYVIWLIVAVSLTVPLQLPADLSVVTFNVPQYRTYDRQNLNPNGSMVGTENQGNRLQNLENMQSLNKNTQDSSENSSQKEPVMRETSFLLFYCYGSDFYSRLVGCGNPQTCRRISGILPFYEGTGTDESVSK